MYQLTYGKIGFIICLWLQFQEHMTTLRTYYNYYDHSQVITLFFRVTSNLLSLNNHFLLVTILLDEVKVVCEFSLDH